MRNKAGSVLMLLGVALIIGALSLLSYNRYEAESAERASMELMPQLVEKIVSIELESVEAETYEPPMGTPIEFLNPADFEMTEAEIDGYAYIGYLTIPKLGLELPVMSGWDYTRLRIAPCRYSGNIREENLVIMAHNYEKHFGRLSDLSEGDVVSFTDMEGKVTNYQVVGQDILPPTAVEEMISGDFDLTLFTCTYGGKSRVTVYCNVLKNG